MRKKEPLIKLSDAIRAFCEDGTWLERQGVYSLTLAEAKQRAVDILESVPTQLQINKKAEIEKRTMIDCYNCKRYESDDACVECRYEPIADTPQTETQTETQNSNLTFEKIQTQVIEFPDTHQKFVFARKIEMDVDSIKICGWEYKGAKDGERSSE